MQQMSAETPRPPLLLCIALDLQTGRGIGALEKNQGVLFACPSVRPPASPFARSPPRSPNISCHLYHDAGVVRILIERLKQRCISIKSIATSLRRGVLEISSAKASRSRDETVLSANLIMQDIPALQRRACPSLTSPRINGPIP